MLKKFIPTILLGCVISTNYAQTLQEKQTSASNIAMTINNLGMIGNAFKGSYYTGSPSCQFPAKSGIEHLFQGGLWVGGKNSNGEISVSTGAFESSAGYSAGSPNFEMTAAVGATLGERSSLYNSPLYNPNAISHQDFYANFTDRNLTVPGTSKPVTQTANGTTIPHKPLGLDVHFESYNWNFVFANFFVILNYEITNNSSQDIDSVYLAMWADGVIRNVNRTAPGGTSFFNKGGNGYVDSLYLGYEFDATGDVGFTESFFALKYLGASDVDGTNKDPRFSPNFKVHYGTWEFGSSGLYAAPQTDLERYTKMTNGLNYRSDWNTIQTQISQPSNRSTLITAGPFKKIKSGEKLTVSFAVICAKKADDGLPNTANTVAQKANLLKNTSWAQTAYNGEDVNANGILDAGEDVDENGKITRFVLPSPPNIPPTKVVARDHAIDIYWTDFAEKSIDPISRKQDFEGYKIYKTKLGYDVQSSIDIASNLELAAIYDKPNNKLGYDNGFEPIRLKDTVRFEGDTNAYLYKYTLNNIQNGWQYVLAVTAFDQGDAVNNLESLESAPLANVYHVFAGKPANGNIKSTDPFVYPNPYYAGASWEGSSTRAEDKKLMFANLPARARVRIFSLAGDLIDSFEHNQSYKGEDAAWYTTYSSVSNTVFSGGEHAWDLLSANSQIIARGLYLYSVEDLDNNKVFQGKFAVIK